MRLNGFVMIGTQLYYGGRAYSLLTSFLKTLLLFLICIRDRYIQLVPYVTLTNQTDEAAEADPAVEHKPAENDSIIISERPVTKTMSASSAAARWKSLLKDRFSNSSINKARESLVSALVITVLSQLGVLKLGATMSTG